MRILVLGGSYFLGKHFVQMACEKHQVTVLNRGSRPISQACVEEIIGDRHDASVWNQLKEREFDAVVDFCAYNKGDIREILEVLGNGCSQYIFISTVDVYMHGMQKVLAEDAPFENREIGGEIGEYIKGKVCLEKELEDCADTCHVPFTTIRPSMIYGTDNYAPREGIYFHWIKQAGQVIHPMDATGEFQFVYVKDVARAILAAIGNPSAFNQAYNLVNKELVTYSSFVDVLQQALPVPFQKVPVSVNTILEKNIPLPFPLLKEESNYYSGEKAMGLIGEYTGLLDGMKETVRDKHLC